MVTFHKIIEFPRSLQITRNVHNRGQEDFIENTTVHHLHASDNIHHRVHIQHAIQST